MGPPAPAIPPNEAARRFKSIFNDNRKGPNVDKGWRVSYLLWDAGIEMPRHQPAILKIVEAIKELPGIDRTEQQIQEWFFKERLERWIRMEAWEDVCFDSWRCERDSTSTFLAEQKQALHLSFPYVSNFRNGTFLLIRCSS